MFITKYNFTYMQVIYPDSWSRIMTGKNKQTYSIHYIIFENTDNFIKLPKTELTD